MLSATIGVEGFDGIVVSKLPASISDAEFCLERLLDDMADIDIDRVVYDADVTRSDRR